jgi:RNA polymerase sigma factor (TIGR02999 family)
MSTSALEFVKTELTSMGEEAGEVTQLLRALGGSSPQPLDDLFSIVYKELRRLAAFNMRGERSNHTLTPTALVHEAWLRLSNQDSVQDRHHFTSLAAQAMRRVLVDHARAKQALIRGGTKATISIGSLDVPQPLPPNYMIALDEALSRLAIIKPRAAQVIELRFFGDMTEEQVANCLNVTRRTVNRDWEMARAWLFDQLSTAKSK